MSTSTKDVSECASGGPHFWLSLHLGFRSQYMHHGAPATSNSEVRFKPGRSSGGSVDSIGELESESWKRQNWRVSGRPLAWSVGVGALRSCPRIDARISHPSLLGVPVTVGCIAPEGALAPIMYRGRGVRRNGFTRRQ